MDLFKQFTGWLGLGQTVKPEVQAMREALEAGRRAKYAEQYDDALEAFNRAKGFAQTLADPASIAIIELHRAEIMTQQGRADEAEALLEALQRSAETTGQQVQVAYILSTRGTVVQMRGDWTGARQYYEQALTAARRAQSQGAEGRALGHLAETYLQEGNASYAAHLLNEAVPKLNAANDTELSSWFVGLLGQATIQNGNEIEGQHLLERALSIAERSRLRAHERHWALVVGERALAESRYTDAQQFLDRGLALFTPARGASYVVALCHLSQALLSQRETARALTTAEQAVEASADLDDSVRAAAQGTLGVALRAAGRSAEAIPHLEASARMNDQPGHSGSRVQIEILRSLAAAQADADDPRAAETYRRAAELAGALNLKLELAQVQRDLGLFYLKSGETQKAIAEWTAAINIYEAQRHYAQVARLYCDIANARKALGQGQRAMKDYEQALMALNSIDESDLETRGLVLSNAANAYVERGDVDSADSFFNEAITIAERTGNQAAESTRRGNYGWFLLTIGRPRRAIATLEQALRISERLNLDLQTALQHDNLGLAYDSLGDYPTALTFHRKALEGARAVGSKRWETSSSINLAATLVMLTQYDEARPMLDSALEAGESLGDSELIARALIGRARLAVREGHPEDADAWLERAIMLARRSDQRRMLAEGLSARSEQLAALGRPDEAGTAWDEAQKIYTVLRMPQGKTSPAWLTSTPTPNPHDEGHA